MIQSIQRAAAILRSFTESEPELSVTELSQRLDLHKSTVSRMLSTLQHERMVEQNPESGKYRLGLGLISLAGVALGRLNARAASQPYLDELAVTAQETINVAVLDGGECVYVERAFSPQPIRYMGWIGRRTPLHCTANGKVMLAQMSIAQRQEALIRPLPKYTENTITDVPLLNQELEDVCRHGYAVVHEEFEEGFSSVAAPIFDHERQVRASLAISGPTFRLNDEVIADLIPALQEVAGKISTDLGYQAGFRGQPS